MQSGRRHLSQVLRWPWGAPPLKSPTGQLLHVNFNKLFRNTKHIGKNNIIAQRIDSTWVAQGGLYYPILSYPILSYTTLSYPILSYPILSYTTLPYPTLSYTLLHRVFILLYNIIAIFPILPYPTLSYTLLHR